MSPQIKINIIFTKKGSKVVNTIDYSRVNRYAYNDNDDDSESLLRYHKNGRLTTPFVRFSKDL